MNQVCSSILFAGIVDGIVTVCSRGVVVERQNDRRGKSEMQS